jgi:hypothetical protein
VHQEEGFVTCFPLDVLMVHSSMLIVATDGERLTCGGFSLGEIVRFGSLKFIADCFGGLTLSTHALSSWERPIAGHRRYKP